MTPINQRIALASVMGMEGPWIQAAVDQKNKTVVIHFGKSVDWLGLRKNEAEHLANMLLEKAKSL